MTNIPDPGKCANETECKGKTPEPSGEDQRASAASGKSQDQKAKHLVKKTAVEEKAAHAPEIDKGVDKTEVKDKVLDEPARHEHCKDAPGERDSILLDKDAGATRSKDNSPSCKSELTKRQV